MRRCPRCNKLYFDYRGAPVHRCQPQKQNDQKSDESDDKPHSTDKSEELQKVGREAVRS